MDIMFNQGKGAKEILPSYEDMKKMIQDGQTEEKESKWKKEIWWKPKTE